MQEKNMGSRGQRILAKGMGKGNCKHEGEGKYQDFSWIAGLDKSKSEQEGKGPPEGSLQKRPECSDGMRDAHASSVSVKVMTRIWRLVSPKRQKLEFVRRFFKK